MDEEVQRMIEQLSGGLPVPQGQPTDPSSLKGLSPEALAALFLVPGKSHILDVSKNLYTPVQTRIGDSGNYSFVDESGKKRGWADLQYKPDKKEVVVSYMQGHPPKDGVNMSSKATQYNSWAHDIGTKDIRSLVWDVGRIFPEAEKVSGLRISGARGDKNLGKPPGFSSQQTLKIPKLPEFGAPDQKLTDLW